MAAIAITLARAKEILEDSISRALANEAHWEPDLGALLPEADRKGRLSKEASVLVNQWQHGSKLPPLFGLMIGVKDIIHVDGLPTMAGGKIPAEVLYGPEASVVTKLRTAGALILGKTATTQFAYFTPAIAKNPIAPGFTPGGSSSGSAAGVAAGLCDVAIGSQTFGSTSRPASYCGVVGYKPSYNRVSTDGFVRCAVSIDHAGFFCRTVPPLFNVASVVMDDWKAGDVREMHPKFDKWTLCVPDGPLLAHCEPTAVESFERTLGRLEKAGFRILRIPSMPDFATLDKSHRSLMAFEYSQFHAKWYSAYKPLYSSHLVELMVTGAAVSLQEAEACRESCRKLRAQLHEAMGEHEFDAWIAPATTGPPPFGLDNTGNPIMSLPWTHSGLPSITVPADRIPYSPTTNQASPNGTTKEIATLLPLGITLAGRWGGDEKLLGLAADVERALGSMS